MGCHEWRSVVPPVSNKPASPALVKTRRRRTAAWSTIPAGELERIIVIDTDLGQSGASMKDRMVAEEGVPTRGWRFLLPRPVLSDCSLGHIETEHSEFRQDSRRTPERVLTAHAPDQSAHLGVDRWSSHFAQSGLPGPVEFEAQLMPSDDSVGLHNRDH